MPLLLRPTALERPRHEKGLWIGDEGEAVMRPEGFMEKSRFPRTEDSTESNAATREVGWRLRAQPRSSSRLSLAEFRSLTNGFERYARALKAELSGPEDAEASKRLRLASAETGPADQPRPSIAPLKRPGRNAEVVLISARSEYRSYLRECLIGSRPRDVAAFRKVRSAGRERRPSSVASRRRIGDRGILADSSRGRFVETRSKRGNAMIVSAGWSLRLIGDA
ncbi:hypothetical protein KM043_006108 [Ampulex compressa]|nr:hypothetical protein KM043_006108 [Ampulex compressa]